MILHVTRQTSTLASFQRISNVLNMFYSSHCNVALDNLHLLIAIAHDDVAFFKFRNKQNVVVSVGDKPEAGGFIIWCRSPMRKCPHDVGRHWRRRDAIDHNGVGRRVGDCQRGICRSSINSNRCRGEAWHHEVGSPAALWWRLSDSCWRGGGFFVQKRNRCGDVTNSACTCRRISTLLRCFEMFWNSLSVTAPWNNIMRLPRPYVMQYMYSQYLEHDLNI